jgi:hypothetical protein
MKLNIIQIKYKRVERKRLIKWNVKLVCKFIQLEEETYIEIFRTSIQDNRSDDLLKENFYEVGFLSSH